MFSFDVLLIQSSRLTLRLSKSSHFSGILYRPFSQFPRDVSTYNQNIRDLCNQVSMGDLLACDKCLSILHEMQTKSKLKPDADTYNGVVNALTFKALAFADMGNVSEVISTVSKCNDLFEQMYLSGVQPEPVTLNTLIITRSAHSFSEALAVVSMFPKFNLGANEQTILALIRALPSESQIHNCVSGAVVASTVSDTQTDNITPQTMHAHSHSIICGNTKFSVANIESIVNIMAEHRVSLTEEIISFLHSLGLLETFLHFYQAKELPLHLFALRNNSSCGNADLSFPMNSDSSISKGSNDSYLNRSSEPESSSSFSFSSSTSSAYGLTSVELTSINFAYSSLKDYNDAMKGLHEQYSSSITKVTKESMQCLSLFRELQKHPLLRLAMNKKSFKLGLMSLLPLAHSGDYNSVFRELGDAMPMLNSFTARTVNSTVSSTVNSTVNSMVSSTVNSMNGTEELETLAAFVPAAPKNSFTASATAADPSTDIQYVGLPLGLRTVLLDVYVALAHACLDQGLVNTGSDTSDTSGYDSSVDGIIKDSSATAAASTATAATTGTTGAGGGRGVAAGDRMTLTVFTRCVSAAIQFTHFPFSQLSPSLAMKNLESPGDSLGVTDDVLTAEIRSGNTHSECVHHLRAVLRLQSLISVQGAFDTAEYMTKHGYDVHARTSCDLAKALHIAIIKNRYFNRYFDSLNTLGRRKQDLEPEPEQGYTRTDIYTHAKSLHTPISTTPSTTTTTPPPTATSTTTITTPPPSPPSPPPLKDYTRESSWVQQTELYSSAQMWSHTQTGVIRLVQFMKVNDLEFDRGRYPLSHCSSVLTPY